MWGDPSDALQLANLRVDSTSDRWISARELVAEVDAYRSSTGRSGSKYMADMETAPASVQARMHAVHAVDHGMHTRGVLWATLSRSARNCDTGPFDVAVIFRCYIAPSFRGRRPSVMQMLWEFMFCEMKRRRSVHTIRLHEGTCALVAESQWKHLFRQTAARNASDWQAQCSTASLSMVPELVNRALARTYLNLPEAISEEQHQTDMAACIKLCTSVIGYTTQHMQLILNLTAGKSVIDCGGRIIYPSSSVGLHSFRIRPEECPELAELANLLEANYHAPSTPQASCIGLLASLQKPEYNGYVNYSNTLAILHSDALQQRRTAVVKSSTSLQQLMTLVPAVRVILKHVLQQLGLAPTNDGAIRCRRLHCLAQDKLAHALFDWHADDVEEKRYPFNMTTAIVQLTNSHTAMRILGFPQMHKFDASGSGVILASAALHRSEVIAQDNLCFKVAFFIY